MSKLNSGFRKGAIWVAVVGGLAAALGAAGQVGGGFGPGPMGEGRPPWAAGPGPARMFAGDDAAYAQFQKARLAELKSLLAITPEQQPAWDAFEAKATEQSQALQALRANAAAGTAQEWVALRGHMMAERQKSWNTMAEARQTLLATLTPEQRTAFDRMPGPPAFAR